MICLWPEEAGRKPENGAGGEGRAQRGCSGSSWFNSAWEPGSVLGTLLKLMKRLSAPHAGGWRDFTVRKPSVVSAATFASPPEWAHPSLVKPHPSPPSPDGRGAWGKAGPWPVDSIAEDARFCLH